MLRVHSIKYFFLLFFVCQFGFAQLSKTHYIPPLTNAEFDNANPEDQYIYLSTPSASDIPYIIKPVGQPISSYISGNVSNTNPKVVSLGTGYGQLFIPSTQTSTIVNNRGYIIEAEGTIYVSVRMNAGGGAQAGALVSKGLSALGTTFRVGSYTNENPQSNYLNFVSVMATEDNTQVDFSNLSEGLIIKNYTGTTPVSRILNKGESYTIATNCFDSFINQDGLIGCLVNSTKPIVVNCGSANGSFGNGGGRDYGIDQIVDISKVGTEYIFVRGDGDNAWENVLIVAHTNNTSIRINGNTSIASINAGQYFVIEGNQYSTGGNMYVETSQPVFAYQGVGGLGNNGTPNEANQGMFFVPPLSCEARGNLDNIANINNIGSTNYSGGISIVTKVGATVTINGAPISVSPNAVTGKPDYITYKVKGLNGNISVQSSDELYCAYFNYNGAATSGSFYSGFPSAPEINFDAQFAALGNCIPNIKLEAANTQNFDSFKWLFDDGSGAGFVDLMLADPIITPSLPGKYKLTGIIACTDEELESIEVPVSICPDDIDNDGIIDNIDIDNDNDGILNCMESRGDVIIDLSNISSPQLIFQDSSINTTIVSSSFNQNNSSGNTTNTFSGSNLGNFTSIVQPANSGESTYELSFTEPLNVKYSENIASAHIETVGEFFIAKILPVNKNITLIDPDNRLLVDSNFDGVFETGITKISGSEIHFKFNPSPLGNTPFEFLANKVDGVSFSHRLVNTTNASTFTGNISLTCYKSDNDLDGVEDSLDLDSDNDGIPDFIENGGIMVLLSNIDADANGLDDIYNLMSTPLDTDNDGIYDFYDLDSDNDGIYDLIETGQLGLLPDTDVDGRVDFLNYGNNGLSDFSETSPDSGLIGYILNDLDGDNKFTYIDLDSDADGCSDVIEAGFSDANGDEFLGDIPVVIDAFGKVNNASGDGYKIPNPDYLIAATVNIETQPINTEVCELSDTVIFLSSTSFNSIQWEVSTNGVNWNTIIDDAFYSGSQTSNLNLLAIPLSYNNFQYRALLYINGNACGFYSNEIELTVHPLPIVNSPVVLIQCDDDDLTTFGFSPFNLTEANNEISNNAANETFTYFKTPAAAVLGDINSSNYIQNPTAYANNTINYDSVWSRIETQFGCFRVSEIQLIVSTTAIPSSFLRVFNKCDDFTDDDDRDGIVTFDFSSVTSEILAFIPSGQNPLPPRYFRNEADALAEENEIINIMDYRNIGYPGSQDIYVRVDSDIANDCLGLGHHITLNVEALPVANLVLPQIACDNDIDINDGIYPFDTSNIESSILNGQSLTNVNILYTYLDTDGITTVSSTKLPDPFLSASQIVLVRVTNINTNDPDGACFDETTIEFKVYEQPIANAVPSQIFCDGDLGDIDNDGLLPFNTSSFESIIRGSQTGMSVFYDYVDENGTMILSAPSLPSTLVSANQTITVTVLNPDNPDCVSTTDIDLTVNPLPEFSVETSQIVCSSDPTFTIILDPIEANATESFNYEWFWTSLDRSIINQFLSNDPTITVSTPGTYLVSLTNTLGCTRTREIFVNASELATITSDDITVVDISNNNSITIDESSLGNGNYEYALEDEFSSILDEAFFAYQDKPFFDGVKPGVYKLYVRDKNGCGTAGPLEISIIGYVRYFTPNGDGANDTWQIKGINSKFQPNSNIHIFDRYGKLLKQLDPLGPGWNGTFNGNLMPNDDYWFKVLLQDGRTFMGHFTLKR